MRLGGQQESDYICKRKGALHLCHPDKLEMREEKKGDTPFLPLLPDVDGPFIAIVMLIGSRFACQALLAARPSSLV